METFSPVRPRMRRGMSPVAGAGGAAAQASGLPPAMPAIPETPATVAVATDLPTNFHLVTPLSLLSTVPCINSPRLQLLIHGEERLQNLGRISALVPGLGRWSGVDRLDRRGLGGPLRPGLQGAAEPSSGRNSIHPSHSSFSASRPQARGR